MFCGKYAHRGARVQRGRCLPSPDTYAVFAALTKGQELLLFYLVNARESDFASGTAPSHEVRATA